MRAGALGVSLADVNSVLKRIDGLTKQARQIARGTSSRAASTRRRAASTTPAMTSTRSTKDEFQNRCEEAADLLAEGLSNKDIATRLRIAIHTVKSHVHNVLEKLALFEAICKARGVTSVTEQDVRAFLAEQASPKLAERFSPSFLLAASQ